MLAFFVVVAFVVGVIAACCCSLLVLLLLVSAGVAVADVVVDCWCRCCPLLSIVAVVAD